MANIYSFDTKSLDFETVEKPAFHLHLRGRIVVVGGNSGTGKTLLCNRVTELQTLGKTSSKVPNNGNIRVFTQDNAVSDLAAIKTLRDMLIIIDEADILLAGSPDIVEFINSDCKKNHYLVFSRGLIDLRVTPNYCAELAETDRVVTLKYATDYAGWY